MPKDGLASAGLVPDEQSFSSGDGNAASQPGGGDEMVSRHLHLALQSATQARWPFVQRALQGADRGCSGRNLFPNRQHLHSPEPGAGWVNPRRTRAAQEVSVEQLSELSEREGQSAWVAMPRAGDGERGTNGEAEQRV